MIQSIGSRKFVKVYYMFHSLGTDQCNQCLDVSDGSDGVDNKRRFLMHER